MANSESDVHSQKAVIQKSVLDIETVGSWE